MKWNEMKSNKWMNEWNNIINEKLNERVDGWIKVRMDGGVIDCSKINLN